jgi:uroporphyrinogen decarboxylase
MGKQLLLDAFKLKKTQQIPWVPFVGVHGASLINKTATEYLNSSDLIVKGQSAAIDNYEPDGIPVVFDLQIEAEALGCELKWGDGTPPAVVSHPLAEGGNINDLKIPGLNKGRISIVMDAAGKLSSKYPDIGIYGLVTGPFTLGLHLLGTDIFLKMMEEPEFVYRLMEFTGDVCLKMTDYYMDQGCDIIAVVDPMTSQIDPVSFHQFVSPYVTGIFDHIRSRKKLSSFFVCGHAQQNIEEMCKCRPDNISIDENIPLDFVRKVALQHGISFGGNLKLTMVLLLGSEEDVQKEALECMEMGGNEGFILAPGCDLPMDTPPENLAAVSRLVRDSYQQDVIRMLDHRPEGVETLNMKDYGLTEKVIVDIITLDSESCAPCQYMVEAVKKVAPQFEGIVEWHEHPIKKIEGISFMSSLMVKNIPTICIDGKISFVSKIPPKNELISAIQQRINEKLKLKIKSRKGEILILYRNDEEYRQVYENVKKAMDETGKQLTITRISKPEILASYGIMNTPAVIIAEYKLKAEGHVPEPQIIKEWIKDI